MLRLQNGYFSSASTEARNVARSSKELPRRFMRAKSQNPTPFSVTTTLSGVKSQSTAELGSDLRLRGSALRAPFMISSTASPSSPSDWQLLQSFSMLAIRAAPSNGSGASAVALWKLRSHSPARSATSAMLPLSAKPGSRAAFIMIDWTGRPDTLSVTTAPRSL